MRSWVRISYITFKIMTRLIRNYFGSKKMDFQCSPKVAWNDIMLPVLSGCLGIIDPFDKSQAMLVKLIVRGLLTGQEKWNVLLRNRMQQCCPPTGGKL